jgi:hypothetical protein
MICAVSAVNCHSSTLHAGPPLFPPRFGKLHMGISSQKLRFAGPIKAA